MSEPDLDSYRLGYQTAEAELLPLLRRAMEALEPFTVEWDVSMWAASPSQFARFAKKASATLSDLRAKYQKEKPEADSSCIECGHPYEWHKYQGDHWECKGCTGTDHPCTWYEPKYPKEKG